MSNEQGRLKTARRFTLLSSPQDTLQNDEGAFYGVSSPSPRDEGVGRGTGRGKAL